VEPIVKLRAFDSGQSAGAEKPAMSGVEWLPACALAGVAGLEYSWRARHFAADHATIPLGWYLAFYAIFTAYPFVFRRRFAELTGPWAVAALGGVVQFPLVYRLVTAAWPNDFPGVLPALFAVPPLLGLVSLRRGATADERTRLNQLALFGGVTLLFITLIFPIQFERQWLTLGWALEGPRCSGSFTACRTRTAGGWRRLARHRFRAARAQPAVFAYHARSSTAVSTGISTATAS